MSAPISVIHVTNSTGLSLNDRFTAFATQPPREALKRRRSRSASRGRNGGDNVPQAVSLANRRLVQQLARKEKMQAALKLKRRSLKAIGARAGVKRGNIRTLRVAPNGKPINANSLTKVATMKADLVNNGYRRPLRRSNSLSNRLGARRLDVGGAAQRVARRQIDRQRRGIPVATRGRSRSRSRARMPATNAAPNGRIRSASRGRVNNENNNSRRGRSRSRSRGRNNMNAGARAALPIKARLGTRPGSGVVQGRSNRRGSISRRGVATGRVQKRRNSNIQLNVDGAGSRAGRARGRPIAGNPARRSRSRTRKGIVGGQQQHQQNQKNQQSKQQRSASVSGRGRRRRSQQRNVRPGGTQNNGNRNNTNGQQKQQRRGRSRSRGGGRNLGRNTRVQPKREDLDKELDQYMATPKTDVDYLLKN